MAIECQEKFGSRRTTTNEQQITTSVETLWWVRGTSDSFEARGALVANAPPIIVDPVYDRALWRTEHEIEQVGPDLWECTVSYELPDKSSPQNGNDGAPQFAFDTTGGTAHITQSKGTRGYGDNAPDYQGAIGVTKDSVEGCDIPIPALKLSYTYYMPAALVTIGYARTLATLTGCMNAQPWRSFAAGEVVFLGAAGSSQQDGIVPITYQFEVQQNVEGLAIGDITGIAKRGWEYLWCAYEDVADETAKATIKRPKWVFVEQVMAEADFSLLGV